MNIKILSIHIKDGIGHEFFIDANNKYGIRVYGIETNDPYICRHYKTRPQAILEWNDITNSKL